MAGVTYSNRQQKPPQYGASTLNAFKQTYGSVAPNVGYQMLNPLVRVAMKSTPTPPSTGSTSLPPNTGFGMLNPGTTLPGSTPRPPAAAPPAAPPSDGAASSSTKNPSTGAGGNSQFDLSSDPVLAQIKALGQRSVADARSVAAANARYGLIGYGSVDLPQSLRDMYASDTLDPIYQALGDADTAAAARANPYSTLVQLAQAHAARQNQVDLASNANNTWYGSAHANLLGDEGRQYAAQEDQAASTLAGLLGQAEQGYLGAQQHAQDQYAAELPNAYQRALQLAQLLGGAPGGSGSRSDSGSGSGGSSGSGSGAGSSAPPPVVLPPILPVGQIPQPGVASVPEPVTDNVPPLAIPTLGVATPAVDAGSPLPPNPAPGATAPSGPKPVGGLLPPSGNDTETYYNPRTGETTTQRPLRGTWVVF